MKQNSYKIFIISKGVENENVEKMEVLTCSFGYYIMMSGSKGLNPHELAHRWVKALRTRPDMSIKVG